MDAVEAYRRVKFQAHPTSELGRVGGPLVDRIDELNAEVARLRAARDAALRWHTQDARMGHDDVRCSSCQEETWPCATVRALVESAQSAVWNGQNAADAALDSATEQIEAEVHALRNDRRNARRFVEAMHARGSMPIGTYTVLLGYLADAPSMPSRATEGEP